MGEPYDSRPDPNVTEALEKIADDDGGIEMNCYRLEGLTGFTEDGEQFAIFYDIKVFRCEVDEDGELRRDGPPAMSHQFVLDRIMAAHQNVWTLEDDDG